MSSIKDMLFDNIKPSKDIKEAVKSVTEKINARQDNQEYEKLLRNIDRFENNINSFLSFKACSPLASALKRSAEAWCELMKARDKYNIANEILLEYKKEEGLKDKIELLSQYVDSINDFSDDNFEAVRRMGYTNHISQIEKSVDKMTDSYNRLQQYEGSDYRIEETSTVKGFIKIECKDIASLKDIPELLEKTDLAREELKSGSKGTYRKIGLIYSYLRENLKSEEDIKALNELEREFSEKKKTLCAEVEKAISLYEGLEKILNSVWFEQFSLSQDNELTRIEKNDDLFLYYKEKLSVLFEFEREYEI